MVGLALGYGISGDIAIYSRIRVTGFCFNNNFATLTALVEVCDLLSAVLVETVFKTKSLCSQVKRT